MSTLYCSMVTLNSSSNFFTKNIKECVTLQLHFAVRLGRRSSQVFHCTGATNRRWAPWRLEATAFFFLHILISTVTGCSSSCGNAMGKHMHNHNAIWMKRLEYWHHRPSCKPAFNASMLNLGSNLVHSSEKRRRNFLASPRPAVQVRPSLRHERAIFECAVNLWLWFQHRDGFQRLQSELPLTGWRVFTAVGGFMKKLCTAYTVQIYAGWRKRVADAEQCDVHLLLPSRTRPKNESLGLLDVQNVGSRATKREARRGLVWGRGITLSMRDVIAVQITAAASQRIVLVPNGQSSKQQVSATRTPITSGRSDDKMSKLKNCISSSWTLRSFPRNKIRKQGFLWHNLRRFKSPLRCPRTASAKNNRDTQRKF